MSPVIAWVVISAIGLFLSAYLTSQSWRDIRALDREHNSNGRRWVARSRLIREGLRVTVHWAWLLLGISVLLEVSLGALFVVALLYGNVVLVVNSLTDARTRAKVYRIRETDSPADLRQADAAERTADATERIAESQEQA